VKKIKVAMTLGFVVAFVAALAGESFGYPLFLNKSRKFGAKDCTFCHVAPEGGAPWNERGQWLIEEKARRGADAIDVEWLAEYKQVKKAGDAKTGDAKTEDKKAEDKKPADKDATPTAAGSVEQDLLKLERDWLDAYTKRDVAAMERIEADDFMITFPDGAVRTKADEIANLKKPAPEGQPPIFMTADTKVRVYGDAAVLTGKVIQKGTYAEGDRKGQDYSFQHRYTDVYVKRNGRWQVVASHLTGIAAPPSTQTSSQAVNAPRPATPATATTAVKVDPKIFDAYVGQYDTPFGLLNITKEGDRLFGQPNNDTKEELIPESETSFNVPAVGVKITFAKDASGQVTHMVLNVNGQEVQAKKTK
jgi:ketosteroid isomerase-like protein